MEHAVSYKNPKKASLNGRSLAHSLTQKIRVQGRIVLRKNNKKKLVVQLLDDSC